MMWMVGKGAGALVAGQLAERYGVRMMFAMFGTGGTIFYTAYWVSYHLVLKKWEKKQNLTEEMVNGEGRSNSPGSLSSRL